MEIIHLPEHYSVEGVVFRSISRIGEIKYLYDYQVIQLLNQSAKELGLADWSLEQQHQAEGKFRATLVVLFGDQ